MNLSRFRQPFLKRLRHIVIFVSVFLLALWLWPNLIHEQLHAIALRLQGISGTINYDWHYPAHPYITKIGDISSVAGGLLFVLLPSVVSLILMVVFHVLLPRVKWGNWEIAAHAVIVYLAFDLAINIMKFSGKISDFKFLTAVPGGKIFATVSVTAIMLWCAWILYVSREEWMEND
jgi:hypothetical protein